MTGPDIFTLLLGVVFFWFAFNALKNRDIKVSGQIYSRRFDPFTYWSRVCIYILGGIAVLIKLIYQIFW